MVDVKTGYEEGGIDLDQLDNYLKLMNNPKSFSTDFDGAKKISLEYLFLPGKKGADAMTAAEEAKKKMLKFIKDTIKDEEQLKKILKNLEVKFVGEDGILKTL
jgi:hypothetical protein